MRARRTSGSRLAVHPARLYAPAASVAVSFVEDFVATLLMVLGGVAILVGWVWLMVCAFAESIPWGIGVLLFSPIGLIFSFFTWPEYKAPTLLYIGGFVLYFLGWLIG
jgi:hypothetical protein